MQFEFYVLNYNFNKKTTEMFNVFQNCKVQKYTEEAIRKYLRSPKKFKHIRRDYSKKEDITLYGFEALCAKIDIIIKSEEWGRSEYEISAGYKFENNCDNLKSWDCYDQASPNIEIITRECIYQYKKQLKELKQKKG